MLNERDLNDLIGRTYDAAVGDEDWTGLVERMTVAVGSTAAVLRWLARPASTAVMVNLDPAAHEAYDTHFHSVDPAWLRVLQLPPGSAFDDGMLVPERALERTEIYNDLYVPNDLHSCLSWYTLDLEAQPICLSIYRSRRHPPYTDEELGLLRAVAPHLDRAVQIEGRLATVAAQREAVAPSHTGPDLSRREQDCLTWIAHGESSKGIARQLALSVYTVNEYIASAMRKLTRPAAPRPWPPPWRSGFSTSDHPAEQPGICRTFAAVSPVAD
jgi:DNA-binding CsgD family transcriptional regulator